MTGFLRITGGLVEQVDERILRTGTLTELLPHLETRSRQQMFLPRSAIATDYDPTNPETHNILFLCELPFGIKRIRKLDRRYAVAMPWTYFLFGFNRGSRSRHDSDWMLTTRMVFHSPEQINNMDQRLWVAFLPNVDEHANICFGSTGVDPGLPLHRRVDALVNEWYLTEFNHDLLSGRQHPFPHWNEHPNIAQCFRRWVAETAEHGPTTFLNWPEFAPGSTLATHRTVAEWLLTTPTRPNEVVPIHVTDALPTFQMPATYGRMEQFFTDMPPDMRHRALVALQNMQADNAEAVAPAPVVPTPADTTVFDENEDGGEPI